MKRKLIVLSLLLVGGVTHILAMFTKSGTWTAAESIRSEKVKRKNEIVMTRKLLIRVFAGFSLIFISEAARAEPSLLVDTAEQWESAKAQSEGIKLQGGYAETEGKAGFFRSKVLPLKTKTKLSRIVFKQSDAWNNWQQVDSVSPANRGDSPAFLALGPQNYWIFGRYGGKNEWKGFEAKDATLDGFDIPLKTTPFPNQYNAPGGLEKPLGGYHGWQSRDMVNWVHHGPVTNTKSRWVINAEYADGKAYIYYDFPNDQDPHLYIDSDLTDGKLGEHMGLAFKDPSDGSDAAIIRDLDGNFHLIYEDWSPINAKEHAWDSPLAGHAVSPNGIDSWKILPPAVDERTTPTGKFLEYQHPHWAKEDPKNFPTGTARYEVHEPEQDAYGDWSAISIGGQYYLFGDFDPKRKEGEKRHTMKVAWFTSPDINKQFQFCGSIGEGHPDPDIGFAEGRFYLFTQTKHDFISPGPWVENVTARVGVDTTNNGEIDTWTDWKEVKERYDHIKGFVKQISREPAGIDLKSLPEGYGFAFEFKTEDTTDNKSTPILDRVTIEFSE